MPGVAIVCAGTSVLTWGSIFPRGLALPLPGDCMTVRHPDFRLMVEEGGWVGAASYYCSDTRDMSMKPGPHSL